ncbi:MAG: CheR family methyltransferase [Bacteroides sp.]|jgi:cheR methyltransferase, SAM binding domain
MSDQEKAIAAIQGSYRAQLSDAEFARLSAFIYNVAGIKMPPAKRIMLQSRLQKRLRELQMDSFKEYTEYLLSERGKQEELIHMLDVVSTNKTDFFREPVHFDFLRETVLPLHYEETSGRAIKIWSAACSSGEEPYTIAMTIAEYCRSVGQQRDYSILGTDISTKVLKMAMNAVYKMDRVEGIPIEILHRYFLRSKDRENPTVRIVPELRKHVKVQRMNFMDESYPINEVFDVIFCRNVLIYFDRQTQEKVIGKLCTKLKPGGYFFLGHSESIMNMDLPLQSIRPTIFRKI